MRGEWIRIRNWWLSSLTLFEQNENGFSRPIRSKNSDLTKSHKGRRWNSLVSQSLPIVLIEETRMEDEEDSPGTSSRRQSSKTTSNAITVRCAEQMLLSAMMQDVDILFRRFSEKGGLSFYDFTEIYLDMEFPTIFLGRYSIPEMVEVGVFVKFLFSISVQRILAFLCFRLHIHNSRRGRKALILNRSYVDWHEKAWYGKKESTAQGLFKREHFIYCLVSIYLLYLGANLWSIPDLLLVFHAAAGEHR